MSLKVLFVINGLGTGGAERSLAEMLPYLIRADISPIVVCFYRRKEGVEQKLLDQGFDIRFLTTTDLISRVHTLRQIIRREKPDLIHTTLFEADIAGRLAAAGTKRAVLSSLVNTSYDPIRLKDPNISTTRLKVVKTVDTWTARHLATHFHAITQAVKTAAVETMRIPAEKVTVIERGRDPRRLGPPNIERRRQVRKNLGLSEDCQLIINVGRQEYQKGQRYLLAAMERLHQTQPQSILWIAGRQGNATPELVQLHRQANFNGQVCFLDHRDDIPDLLAAADLFVFPSLYEGLGGALIEAMALGLPIVASRIPVIQEVVEEDRNALLVEPTSPEKLAEAIEILLNNREKAAIFGRRSREIFEERFMIEKSMSRIIELYYQVANVKDDRKKSL